MLHHGVHSFMCSAARWVKVFVRRIEGTRRASHSSLRRGTKCGRKWRRRDGRDIPGVVSQGLREAGIDRSWKRRSERMRSRSWQCSRKRRPHRLMIQRRIGDDLADLLHDLVYRSDNAFDVCYIDALATEILNLGGKLSP